MRKLPHIPCGAGLVLYAQHVRITGRTPDVCGTSLEFMHAHQKKRTGAHGQRGTVQAWTGHT